MLNCNLIVNLMMTTRTRTGATCVTSVRRRHQSLFAMLQRLFYWLLPFFLQRLLHHCAGASGITDDKDLAFLLRFLGVFNNAVRLFVHECIINFVTEADTP